MNTTETFARKCSITNQGMNEGYVVGEGDMYFSTRKLLVQYLKTLDWVNSEGISSKDMTSDNELVEFFYNELHCYYTEWGESDHQYIMQNGILTEIE